MDDVNDQRQRAHFVATDRRVIRRPLVATLDDRTALTDSTCCRCSSGALGAVIRQLSAVAHAVRVARRRWPVFFELLAEGNRPWAVNARHWCCSSRTHLDDGRPAVTHV
jgi:hypothetical protein